MTSKQIDKTNSNWNVIKFVNSRWQSKPLLSKHSPTGHFNHMRKKKINLKKKYFLRWDYDYLKKSFWEHKVSAN